MITSVSEEPAASVFRVEMSRPWIWMGDVGKVGGSSQGAQEDWPVTAMEEGRKIALSRSMGTGYKKALFRATAMEGPFQA